MKASDILAYTNAVITGGHFVYTAGDHGSAYINKDAIYTHTHETSMLCLDLANLFVNDCVEVVIAPAVGAIILAQWVAHHLSRLNHKVVFAIYADKKEKKNKEDSDEFEIKRGYQDLVPGKRVLVVEDLFTTGGSAKKIMDLVHGLKGEVIGVCGLANRGNVQKADVGNPPRFESLVHIQMERFPAHECPLCKQGVPVNTNLGHGKKFLEEKTPK